MRSFAAETLGRGESEGLYRTVSDVLRRAVGVSRPKWVLDLGCGPGRTLADAATAFPRSRVVGIDGSLAALAVAYAVCRLRGPAVEVDLSRWGFGTRTIEARALKNVCLVQADAQHLPFQPGRAWRGFDAVTCVNLLDRVENPDMVLDEVARVTCPGARFVLASPLNWRQPDGRRWDAVRDVVDLRAAVEERGFDVQLAFDGLVYREILDSRGSATDWRVALLSARRRD